MGILKLAILPIMVSLITQPAPRQSPSRDSAASEQVPIVGIANITFKVSDLGKAHGYYQGVLGLSEAFDLKDASGKTSSVYFKINDDQYIEVTPNLKPGELIREGRVVFQSSDLKRLHDIYAERGLQPGTIVTGPDGNAVFQVVDPEGNALDFIQYTPGSRQELVRGQFLSANRVTMHISHVGMMMKDRATGMPFYQKLGFEGSRTVPGGKGEFIELPSSDRNLETKDPPLDPNDAATHDQYLREVYGAVYHVGLEVQDIRIARDLMQQRGRYSDVRVRATVGNNRHWLIHVFDPDGSRSEIMEAGIQTELPPGTIMAPGAPAPPILPPAKKDTGPRPNSQ